MFIADTDVLIDFLRGKGAAERIDIELKTGKLCVTAITAFELWAGAGSPQQAAMVEALLAAVTILLTRNRKHYERIPGLNLGLTFS